MMSIEFYEAVTGERERVAPSMLLIVCWAYERNLLSRDFILEMEWELNLNDFKLGVLSAYNLVVDILGGEVREDDFVDEIECFLDIYVRGGAYDRALIEHYEISSILLMPSQWNAFPSMFPCIDKVYEYYKKFGVIYDKENEEPGRIITDEKEMDDYMKKWKDKYMDDKSDE